MLFVNQNFRIKMCTVLLHDSTVAKVHGPALVNVNVNTFFFFIKIPHIMKEQGQSRVTDIFAVTYFGIGVASVNEKRQLTMPLVRSCPLTRSCQYLSVCQNYQIFPSV